MSTIFAETTPLVPLTNATIRVLNLMRTRREKTDRYISTELLEFHADLRERHRCIFRSYAYVRPHPALLVPEHAHLYLPCGDGSLAEPYLRINELYIHDADVREMLSWCKQHELRPLIIHPCPLPSPIFARGTQVRVVRGSEAVLNQSGTVTSALDQNGLYCIHCDHGLIQMCHAGDIRAAENGGNP